MCYIKTLAFSLLVGDEASSLFSISLGANPEEIECYNYAKDYLTIISLGIPFYVIGQGLNPSIRSDGSPRYIKCY